MGPMASRGGPSPPPSPLDTAEREQEAPPVVLAARGQKAGGLVLHPLPLAGEGGGEGDRTMPKYPTPP